MIEKVLLRFAAREQSKMPLDLPDARILVAEVQRLRARVAALEQERDKLRGQPWRPRQVVEEEKAGAR